MPKPLFGDNGSGMHVHQLAVEGRQAAVRRATATPASRDMALWYIGGMLKHAPAILAFAAPTTNSYKRLVPGYEAPVNLVYSQPQPFGRLPHPAVLQEPEGQAGRVPLPRPGCNPYLAFSAILMAGLDGILNKIEPRDPVDKDLYDLPPEELAKVPQVPGFAARRPSPPSEADHEFLSGRRRLHRRPHRNLGQLQADARDRPRPPAAPPLGVLPLLRHLGSELRLYTVEAEWPEVG